MSEGLSAERFLLYSTKVSALFAAVPVHRYRTAAYLFTCAWFLIILSELFWSLIPVPNVQDTATVNHRSTVKKTTKNSASNVNLNKLQQWSLFGLQDAEPEVIEDVASVVADDVNDNAKETRLSLVLMGAIKASVPENSWALISHQSKSELYKIGDKIPGGRDVTLSKVLSDRVIIDNRGSYEALLLWDEKRKQSMQAQAVVAKKPQPKASKKLLDQRKNNKLSSLAGGYRKQLLSNPMSLSDVIKVSVAKDSDGNIIGYRVRPGRHRKQFTDFGLKSGDIVTSVNGTGLDDPSQAMQLYGQLREMTEASLEIKRGEEILTIMISLGDE